MGLSTAERNRNKRERKKREREEQRKLETTRASDDAAAADNDKESLDQPQVEIEYVAEPVLQMAAGDGSGNADGGGDSDAFEALRRFQERVDAIVVSDDERGGNAAAHTPTDAEDGDGDDDEYNSESISKRRIRDMIRPSVAELKRRVERPDLVEAHDVTASDPEFLIQLKAVPGTVPVPRHWGRKRKYLQGKRGFEKPPFQLPEFIENTGITELRGTVAEDEDAQNAKQKNRGRVAPKMGAIDVDYRTLHDAFFKHQTKPKNLTQFGDVYYEGKELEVQTDVKPGGTLSHALREALGMTLESSPPPWLLNMQRYGPPPSFSSLKIPGLNAPLPSSDCQYGYHPGGWGKPPLDPYGRPLYGGNPFDAPGSSGSREVDGNGLVTSDGKTVAKADWGALPTGYLEAEEDESEEDESSDEEMDESEEDEAEEGEEAAGDGGIESVLPPPLSSSTAPVDLRKQPGDETPLAPPKQLYQVIDQTKASADQQSGNFFASDVTYGVPGTAAAATTVAAAGPEGAESVLSKAVPGNESGNKRKANDDDDEDGDLGKNFKF